MVTKKIEGAQITDAKGHGINIEGSKGENVYVSNTKIRGAGGDGIRLGVTPSPTPQPQPSLFSRSWRFIVGFAVIIGIVAAYFQISDSPAAKDSRAYWTSK